MSKSGRSKRNQVASISANDKTIGELIADAMEKVGKDGVITVEESKGIPHESGFRRGMQFDKGYISPYMVTDPERMEAVIEEPYILLIRKEDFGCRRPDPSIGEGCTDILGPLVIIAEDVDGEALATLVVNKLRGTINIPAVKAPDLAIDGRQCWTTSLSLLMAPLSLKKSDGN